MFLAIKFCHQNLLLWDNQLKKRGQWLQDKLVFRRWSWKLVGVWASEPGNFSRKNMDETSVWCSAVSLKFFWKRRLKRRRRRKRKRSLAFRCKLLLLASSCKYLTGLLCFCLCVCSTQFLSCKQVFYANISVVKSKAICLSQHNLHFQGPWEQSRMLEVNKDSGRS